MFAFKGGGMFVFLFVFGVLLNVDFLGGPVCANTLGREFCGFMYL